MQDSGNVVRPTACLEVNVLAFTLLTRTDHRSRAENRDVTPLVYVEINTTAKT